MLRGLYKNSITSINFYPVTSVGVQPTNQYTSCNASQDGIVKYILQNLLAQVILMKICMIYFETDLQ